MKITVLDTFLTPNPYSHSGLGNVSKNMKNHENLEI